MIHQFTARVYIEDVDIGGIVYYANYLKFAERSRTEFIRSLGIVQSSLLEKHGLLFVVKQCVVDYNKPARLDNLLIIETHIQEFTRASFVMNQEICLAENSLSSSLVTLKTRLACINREGRVQRLPEFLYQYLLTL